MPLNVQDAQRQAKVLLEIRQEESGRLDKIHEYLRDDPERKAVQGMPAGAPDDVVRLARISRVNLLKYVVTARTQGLYVDGFQSPDSPDNAEVWDRVWQPNQLDARQIGVHRAALGYGASYTTVLPDPRRPGTPSVRGATPRQLTAAYGDDDMWPEVTLEKRRQGWWRMLDREAVYWLRQAERASELVLERDPVPHKATWDGVPVCPVVRFRDTDDLDDPAGRGVVEPYIPLQDQINFITFSLMVALHFGAFRQKYVIGWLASNQQEAMQMGAARMMVFPPDAGGDDSGDAGEKIKVGEFAQTEPRGYLESRQSSVRHMAITSQTPVNDLLGDVTNVGADALEALRASYHAAVEENKTMLGEAWEQTLGLGGQIIGVPLDPAASAIWRDTRIRSLSEAATALGTVAEKLGVPPQALWSRLPGVPQHERQMWAAMLESGGSELDRMMRMLDRQAAGAAGGGGGGPDA